VSLTRQNEIAAVVLGLLASILLLIIGTVFWLRKGSYNPLLMVECIWFWGYTVSEKAGVSLAHNFKLLALSFFNPFVYLFSVNDYESSNSAVMRMGVDANILRNAGGTFFFSAAILLVLAVLSVFLPSHRINLKQLALLVIKIVLPVMLFFTLLWFSFISTNPTKKSLFWISLTGVFYFVVLQTA
jgi:hypothetical protein